MMDMTSRQLRTIRQIITIIRSGRKYKAKRLKLRILGIFSIWSNLITRIDTFQRRLPHTQKRYSGC